MARSHYITEVDILEQNQDKIDWYRLYLIEDFKFLFAHELVVGDYIQISLVCNVTDLRNDDL